MEGGFGSILVTLRVGLWYRGCWLGDFIISVVCGMGIWFYLVGLVYEGAVSTGGMVF